MANNKKISQFAPLLVPASNDIFPIVDTSVPSFENKRITLARLMGSPGPIGVTNPSDGVFSSIIIGGVSINEFSVDPTLEGNSDTVIPTEKAIKSYVDTSVGNAVKLNIVYTSIDTTAVIGDVVIVDSGSGDVEIELLLTGNIGKFIVYKDSNDSNNINIIPSSGTIDGQLSDSFNFPYSSKEYLTDSTNIYTI